MVFLPTWLITGYAIVGEDSYNYIYGIKEGAVLFPGSLILLERSQNTGKGETEGPK
jgi:hypothetical protein